MNDIEVIKSALCKLKYQKENFGFMERFTVDENWVVTKILEEYLEKKAKNAVKKKPNMDAFKYGRISGRLVGSKKKRKVKVR